MTSIRNTTFTLVFVFLFITCSPWAKSQPTEERNFEGNIIFGGGAKPDFEGSSDYEATPIVAGKMAYGPYYLELKGASLRANVSPWSNIEFGLSFSYELGRDDDVENERVAKLREIDSTLELGGFVKIPFKGVFHETGELSFDAEYLADTSDTYDGYKISFGPSYHFAPSQKLVLGLGVSATFASEEYNQTFFGIDEENALRSGFSEFSADSGIKDIGMSISLSYLFNQRWGMTGLLSYKELIGDAADSPIVDLEGATGQGFAGIGLLYRF